MVDLNIPVDVSDFEKLRENNYYYIDKTGFISKLLQTKSAEVTLITRPRRFGKTLGMRMLASFFDIRKDSRTIFEGLEISKNTALCDEWMNQYPTLFLSFKENNSAPSVLNWAVIWSLFMEIVVTIFYFINER